MCLIFTCPLVTCCSGGDARYDSRGDIDAARAPPPPCLGGARRRRAHARKRSCGDSLPMSSQSDLGADLTHNVPAACSVKNKRVGRLLISPHDRSSNHSQLGTDTLMNNEACRAM